MPEEKKLLMYHKGVKQLMAKPQIEEIIPDYLDGEFRNAAIQFIEWLRANKMSLRQSTPGNTDGWRAVYKGKAICGIIFINHVKAFGILNPSFTIGTSMMMQS
jgi:hypothetical protein